jgi:hypothetical protein
MSEEEKDQRGWECEGDGYASGKRRHDLTNKMIRARPRVAHEQGRSCFIDAGVI